MRKIIIGLLVTLFSLGLTGVVFAEDDYPLYEQGNLFQVGDVMTEAARSNIAPEDSATPENIEKINPLFCTDELVEDNDVIAKNTCTEEDILFQGG